MMERCIVSLLISAMITLTGCSTVTRSNPPTGSYLGPVLGGLGGAAAAGLLGASKTGMIAGGIAGAGLGYYLTSMRFDSAGIIHAGGQVFVLGDMVTIEIPTDHLFDTNTADFLPGTEPILDSIASILNRYPSNNVLISGNTSGFASQRFEQPLSEERARQVAGYLWAHGVNGSDQYGNIAGPHSGPRKQIYVGYGDHYPIANDIRLKGIRQNSRIQITSFPTQAQLHVDGCYSVFNNIGAMETKKHCFKDKKVNIANAFAGDYTSDAGTNLSAQTTVEEQVPGPAPTTQDKDYNPSLEEEIADQPLRNYNSIESSLQTEEAAKESKQAGYKGESRFKDD